MKGLTYLRSTEQNAISQHWTILSHGTPCASDSHCDGGVCIPNLEPGSPCAANGECITGFCVDSVCCDDPCQDQCWGCAEPNSPGTCLPLTGTACEDSDLCNSGDTCQNGICEPGSFTTGCINPSPCERGVCNPATGQCEVEQLGNGEACQSEDLCLAGSTCQEGVCTGGAPVSCPPPGFFEFCIESYVCNPRNRIVRASVQGRWHNLLRQRDMLRGRLLRNGLLRRSLLPVRTVQDLGL